MTETNATIQPYRPGVDGPWGRAEASHLVRRLAFGAPPELVAAAQSASPNAAAEDLLRLRPESEDVEFVRARVEPQRSIAAVQGAWLYAMMHSTNPAREKLALFWHGHFATSDRKIEQPNLMHRQIELFRRLGAGGFGELAHAVAKDPAMLLWLDGNSNRSGRPNENFARELMELFTLGIGNYTEADIKEAARAFTGWHVRNGEFVFERRAHDRGEKTVFGRSGAWEGHQIVDFCLEKAACARFIATKLYEFYVAPNPSPELAAALAEMYEAGGKSTAEFVAKLCSSRAFFAPEARRALVASPVDFAVGALRTLGGSTSATELAESLAEMGQDICRPPSVKGWKSGLDWLSSTTLVARMRFASTFVRAGRHHTHIAWTDLAQPSVIERFFPEGLDSKTQEAVIETAEADRAAIAEGCLQLPEAQFV